MVEEGIFQQPPQASCSAKLWNSSDLPSSTKYKNTNYRHDPRGILPHELFITWGKFACFMHFGDICNIYLHFNNSQ